VLDILFPAARDKGLALTLSLDPELPKPLLGDAGRIRQVLLNLVGNAVKFTEAGEVRLDIYPLAVPAQGGRLAVHFSVADTGIGMSHEQLQHIFEPFTQVESPYTRSHGGAGLGLTVVARLTTLMGGRIEVYSEPGHGTEVHLTLPLRPLDEGAAEEPALINDQPLLRAAQEAASAPPSVRVLVVEDDMVNRITIVKHLERLGHRPQAVSNGEAALETLATQHFDLVLMDIQMPGMDGLETTRRIRSGEDRRIDPRTPIVALTAHAMQGDRMRFLDVGMDSYLSKPYRVEELQAAILGALPRP
jgi:CheY-like chemotaxis protein